MRTKILFGEQFGVEKGSVCHQQREEGRSTETEKFVSRIKFVFSVRMQLFFCLCFLFSNKISLTLTLALLDFQAKQLATFME